MNKNIAVMLCVASVLMTSADATPLDELTAPAVPEVHIHISNQIMAVITLCVASVICLFGYQSHSLVFCYSGYIVGHSLFAVVYLYSAGVVLGGWFAWATIATGVVFSIIAVANSRVGLTTTAVAVGTAAAGFLSPVMLAHIAGDQAVIVGLTWCGTVVVAIVLICVAPKPTLIRGTAGLGAFFVVSAVATLGWSASMFLANGLHTSEMYAFYIATTVLFLVGLVTQWALSRGDEFDVHGRRRFYPTTFRYSVKKNTQPQLVEENTGTQLVYGV